MADDENGSADDAVADLWRARHTKLRTALPFPELDWSDETAVSASLERLRDFVESIAHGAIDWYLEKKTVKKRIAVVLHWWTYFFGVLAAIIPLGMLYVGTFFEPELLARLFGINVKLSSIAAETALLLIGIAGAATLIDRSAGYTTDWMRYMTTAALINQARLKFLFAWNELEWTLPYPPLPAGSTPRPKPVSGLPATTAGPAPDGPDDPVARRIYLAREFCFEVLDLVGKETSVWTDELKQRVAQMASQFPGHHRT